MMHVASQTVPPGFSYPPHMLFSPQTAPVQAFSQDTFGPASQVVISTASPAQPTDYQLLDYRIRAIEGFFAFDIDA